MVGSPILRWLFMAVLSLMTASAQALEVRETVWGFDGRMVPGRFNPVSVLVDNPRPAAFDGEILLTQNDGNRRGVDYVQPVFLAPHTARWVQFHVFVNNSVGHYLLQWGRGAKDRYELVAEIKLGPPSCVWLRDSANPFAVTGALKSFPDELFPTTVVATDGLDAVVLDHGPRWEQARREAFLDWLKRGGTVHLLPAADSRYPVFAEGLEALNAEGDLTRIGAGRLVRHSITPREMSEKYLAERGYPPRALAQAQSPVVYDLEATLFQRLSSLTRPAVSWTTIHLLALAYIAVIGPLHYRFRRKLDYRLSILVFLGIVAVFGTAFAIVGRRGYGESQTVHSLAIARALGGGRCDTTQWISAFATTGDLYTLTHPAPANLYATGSNVDDASGRARNGKDGRIEIDIPLYSSRTFIHRAVMTGDDTAVTVEKWETDANGLRALRLIPGTGFPKGFENPIVRAGDAIYELTPQGIGLELKSSKAQPMGAYFSREKLSPLTAYNRFAATQGPDVHRTLLPLLAARALGAKDVFQQTAVEPPRPAEQLQLCIVAPAPAAFQLRGAGFSRERGWVLYVQDVFKP